MLSPMGSTNTFPSPIEPVFAAPTITATTLSTMWSATTTSIFTLGRKSTVYSEPRYSSVWPFWRPKPRTSVTVMPTTPISVRASFTSSSLNGLMIASIFFMASHLVQNWEHERRDVGADALEVRQDVQVDLRRLQRFGQPRPQPAQVRFTQLTLAGPHERPLVQHLASQRPVVGGERRDRSLQVLGDQAVELLDLGPAGLREPAALIVLLPGQLHQVLVDDVADVLEVADEGDHADLLAGELRAHRLPPQPGQEELDLALHEIELVVALLDLLDEREVVRAERGQRIAQHPLRDVGHAQGLAVGLTERQRGLIERPLVEILRAERRLLVGVLGHQRLDRPRRERRERQEHQADAEVEQAVGVGHLPGGIGGRRRDRRGERTDEREHHRGAQHLEGDVGHG